MAKRYYHKLIRDLVPEVMAAKGVTFDVREMDREEFVQMLLRKVSEEAAEVASAQNRDEVIAEVGDLLDVLDAVRREFGITEDELRSSRERQLIKKGSFAKRLYLLWSEDPE